MSLNAVAYIPLESEFALWELVNKRPYINLLSLDSKKEKLVLCGCCLQFVGSLDSLYFQLLNKDFKCGLCFTQCLNKFALKDNLIIRTYCPHIQL